jgi:hypothetical protein
MEYWWRTLSMGEFFTNNGYPLFDDVIMKSIKLEDLAGLIEKNIF